ncbi:MAG TPA: two-component regulator propeller domain-containing protein, partial [Povalibacter sp.]
RYRNNPSDPQSLSGDSVVTLFQDRQGNVWVALHGMPLNLFQARTPAFRKLPSRPRASHGRAEKMVNTILEVNGQSLWISFIGMLSGVDFKTGEREDLSERLRLDANVISMAQDVRGRVWLGTDGSGLVSVDPSGGVLRFRNKPADPATLAGDVVNDILVDHAQNLWLATWGGLSRFDEPRGRFETYKPPGMDPKYLALAEDDDHQLWLATHLDGLQRFNPATGEFVTYPATGNAGSLSNGRVNAVHVDRRGIVWAGTQNGLDALDPATGRIRNYQTDDGLPGNAVSCILEDEQDGIWLGTNNGIARLDARTGEFQNFTRADGLPGMDFTGWGSCHRGRSNEFFFAGFAGATAFKPERMRALSYVPPIEFTDLLIAGRRYPDGPSGSQPLILPELQKLTLPYAQNTIAAGFAALSYTNPASSRYRFRLTGLEEEWHSVGSDRRVASYNSLPPGNYRLEVQGAAGTGPWSATKNLEFTIQKPWWQTTPFRMAVGILLLGLAWLAYWLRVQQVTHQFEIRLDERVAERTRIARELHDSLLQGFHGLMFRLQAVRNLLPQRPQEAADALDDALNRGDETVEEARVAVTDLRTFGSGESDLETALRAMAQGMPMLTRADAPSCRIGVEGEPRAMIPLVRDQVLQVAREAFRNAVLHARARLVEVEVSWRAERFSLRVRDDGVGLDPKLLTRGPDGHWGLHGMRERTRQVGGSLEIRSENASGTEVELSIPAVRAYSKNVHPVRERQHD